MDWIEELLKNEGKKVILKNPGVGHTHWGFIPGEIYEIKEEPDSYNLAFFGKFSKGSYPRFPLENYAGWEFVRAKPIVLENK